MYHVLCLLLGERYKIIIIFPMVWCHRPNSYPFLFKYHSIIIYFLFSLPLSRKSKIYHSSYIINHIISYIGNFDHAILLLVFTNSIIIKAGNCSVVWLLRYISYQALNASYKFLPALCSTAILTINKNSNMPALLQQQKRKGVACEDGSSYINKYLFVTVE